MPAQMAARRPIFLSNFSAQNGPNFRVHGPIFEPIFGPKILRLFWNFFWLFWVFHISTPVIIWIIFLYKSIDNPLDSAYTKNSFCVYSQNIKAALFSKTKTYKTQKTQTPFISSGSSVTKFVYKMVTVHWIRSFFDGHEFPADFGRIFVGPAAQQHCAQPAVAPRAQTLPTKIRANAFRPATTQSPTRNAHACILGHFLVFLGQLATGQANLLI